MKQNELEALMSDFVVLLGTKGNPTIYPGSNMRTSNLLNMDSHKIVIDCGLGVGRALTEQGVQLKDISC